MDGFSPIWDQMTSNKKLERDRGLINFQRFLDSVDPDIFTELTQLVDVKKNISRENQNNLNIIIIQKNEDNDKHDIPECPDQSGHSSVSDESVTAWEFTHAVLATLKVTFPVFL